MHCVESYLAIFSKRHRQPIGRIAILPSSYCYYLHVVLTCLTASSILSLAVIAAAAMADAVGIDDGAIET